MIYLLKFGKKSHMEDFRRNGLLYMNSVSFFKNLENHGNVGDKNEGLVECFQSDKIDVIFKNPTDQSTIISTKNGSLTLTGQLRTWDALIDHQNIYCMYALKYKGVQPLIDDKNIEFGDTYVAITKPEEFLNRIKATAKKTNRIFELIWSNMLIGKNIMAKWEYLKKSKNTNTKVNIALLSRLAMGGRSNLLSETYRTFQLRGTWQISIVE